MSARAVLLTILIISVSSVVSAADVQSWACKTTLEHAGDPAPVQVFELIRKSDGLYEVSASKDLKVSPAKIIASGLDCKFTKVEVCPARGLYCTSKPVQSMEPGEVNNVLFSCFSKEKSLESRMQISVRELNEKAVLSGNTVSIFAFPDTYSFSGGSHCAADLR